MYARVCETIQSTTSAGDREEADNLSGSTANSVALALAGLACDSADPEDTAMPMVALAGPSAPEAMALRIAVDMMSDGAWWTSQTTPPAFLTPLSRIARCIGAAPLDDILSGQQALAELEVALAELSPLLGTVDPAWVASVYEPAASNLRVRLKTEALMDAAGSTPADGVADLSALAAGIDELRTQFQSLVDQVGITEALVGQKFAGEVVKAGDLKVLVPSSENGGATELFGAQDMIAWLEIAKVFLVGVQTGGSLPTTFGPLPDDPGEKLLALNDRTKRVVGGVTSISSSGLKLGGYLCRLLSTGGPEADRLAKLALTFEDASRQLPSSHGPTALSATFSMFRAVFLVVDQAAADEVDSLKLIEAGVEATKAAAGYGLLATGSGLCSAATMAIPVGWWVFKQSIRELGETRLGVTGALAAEEIEQMLEGTQAVLDAFNQVVVVDALVEGDTDAEWSAARDRAMRGFAAAVVPVAERLRVQSGGWRANHLRGLVQGVFAMHEGVLGNEPSVHGMQLFADDLADCVSMTMEDIPRLIGIEAGFDSESRSNDGRPDARAERTSDALVA